MDFARITQLLTAEEKADYLELLKMFESAGWQLFKQQFAGLYEGAVAAFEHADTWEANRYAKGQRDTLALVLASEDGLERYYELIATTRENERLENLADADRSME